MPRIINEPYFGKVICTLPNKEQTVQVSDTTQDDQGYAVG